MLRIDLLRGLSAAAPDNPPETSTRRARPVRLLFILLILALVVGGVLSVLMQPQQMKARGKALLTFVTHLTDREAPARARADSLHRAEVLQVAASRRVAESQSQTIAWLQELETVMPSMASDGVLEKSVRREPADYVFSLAAFTPPESFVLHGNARSLEALATLQEALILFPGMELKQSDSKAAEQTASGPQTSLALPLAFAFAGTVALEEDDSIPPTNRVLSAARLEAELGFLIQSAADLGITLSAPDAGAISPSGTLQIHTHRLSASCDSVGFAPISTLLEGERYRGSPFGIQRVTLLQKGNVKTVFLDIMAFSP